MLSYADVVELFQGRRSIRRFKPDPIPEDHLRLIVDAARWAPSGANTQPWHFLLVRERQTKEKLFDVYAAERDFTRATDPTIKANPNRVYLKEAPIVVAVCGDTSTRRRYMTSRSHQDTLAIYVQSMSNAALLLQLAATSLGIGSLWVTTREALQNGMRAALGLPDFATVEVLVPLGYPLAVAGRRSRKPLEAVLHDGRFEVGKLDIESGRTAAHLQPPGPPRTVAPGE